MDTETQVRQALARGYCSPDNAKKEVDAELIEAMAKEVVGASISCDRPHLGLATTRELLDELRARIEMHATGGLDYRTVDGENFAKSRPTVRSLQEALDIGDDAPITVHPDGPVSRAT